MSSLEAVRLLRSLAPISIPSNSAAISSSVSGGSTEQVNKRIASLEIIQKGFAKLSEVDVEALETAVLSRYEELIRDGLSSSNIKYCLQSIATLHATAHGALARRLVPLFHSFMPALVARLGDVRSSVSSAASEALPNFFNAGDTSLTEIAKVLNNVICNHESRLVRRQTLEFMEKFIKSRKPFPSRATLTTVVLSLEDDDEDVRNQAKDYLVTLYRYALTSGDSQLLSDFSNCAETSVYVKDIMKTLSKSDKSDSPAQISTSAGGKTTAKVKLGPAVETVKQLEMEFATFATLFRGKETEANWENRDNSLQRLKLIVESGGTRFESFPSLLKSIYDDILKVTLSLRTQLNLSGCALIETLAEHMGSAFEPFAEATVSMLLKMGGQNKRVVVTTSIQTMNTLIRCTRYPKIALHFMHAVHDKSPQVRSRGIDFILTLVRSVEPSSLQRQADTVEKCIRRAIVDANPEVRSTARDVFWAYQDIFPDAANAVLNSLDAVPRKLLSARPTEQKPTGTASSMKPLRPKSAATSHSLSRALPSLPKTPAPSSPQNVTQRQSSAKNIALQNQSLTRSGTLGSPNNGRIIPLRSSPESPTSSRPVSRSGSLSGRLSTSRLQQKPTKSPSSVPLSSSRLSLDPIQIVRDPILNLPAMIEQIRSHDSKQRLDGLSDVTDLIRRQAELFQGVDKKIITSPIPHSQLGQLITVMSPIFQDIHFLVIQHAIDAGIAIVNYLTVVRQHDTSLLRNLDDISVEILLGSFLAVLYDPKFASLPGLIESADQGIMAVQSLTLGDIHEWLSIMTKVVASVHWSRKSAVKRGVLDHFGRIENSIKDEFMNNGAACRLWLNRLMQGLADTDPSVRQPLIMVLRWFYNQKPTSFQHALTSFDSNIINLCKPAMIVDKANESVEELNSSVTSSHGSHEELIDDQSPTFNPLSPSFQATSPSHVAPPSEVEFFPDKITALKLDNIEDLSSPVRRRMVHDPTQLLQSPATPHADWYPYLPELIEKITSGNVDLLALQKIAKLSRENNADIWTAEFYRTCLTGIIRFLGDRLKKSDERENMLVLLKQLILNQTDLLRGSETRVLHQLFESRCDSSIEVCSCADDVIDTFVNILTREAALAAFYGLYPDASQSDMPTIAFSYLASACRRLNRAEILNEMPRLVPYILRGFNDPQPDVRKSVVDLLVQLYRILEDDLYSHLGALTLPQKKLLVVYIERMRKPTNNSD